MDPERERELLAEASQLLKCVRTGRLRREQLDLLGCLGYPAALEALAEDAPPEVDDLKRWLKRLDGFGPEVCARMIVAAARLLLPLLEAKREAYPESLAAVEAGEAWLACPCEEHARVAEEAHTRAIAAAVKTKSDATETGALVAAFAAIAVTGHVAAMDPVADVADVTGEAAVRRAVIQALLPWALRRDDE